MLERLPGIFEITLEEREGGDNTIQLYLIKGNDRNCRNLLVDTSYYSQPCFEKLLRELETIGVEPEMLDVFLTHKHADHCGLASALEERGARIFMSFEEDRHEFDCLYYRTDRANEEHQRRVLTGNGITKELAPLIWEKYMDVNLHLDDQESIWKMTMAEFQHRDIRVGDCFAYGEYAFEAISLRGHTYGQMGLVDREKCVLLVGDQVLNRTTPIVGTSYVDEHLLKCYLDSVHDIGVTYRDYCILPAHEGPIENLDAVIQRINKSYQKKIAQTYECLERNREKTVWEVAKTVYGLTPAKRSDEAFFQAKLITTKTFSMLEYLYDMGMITRRAENGTLLWSRKADNEER